MSGKIDSSKATLGIQFVSMILICLVFSNSIDAIDDNAEVTAARTLVPVQVNARGIMSNRKSTSKVAAAPKTDTKKAPAKDEVPAPDTRKEYEVPTPDTRKEYEVSTPDTRKAPAKDEVPTSDTRKVPAKDETSTTSGKTTCPIRKPRNLRFMRRVIERSQKAAKTNGAWELYENEWITSVKVNSGDKVNVVDLSGCSAIYFWDSASIPSVFHIFCGEEAVDSAKAAEELSEMGRNPVFVTVGAPSKTKFETIRSAIRKEFPDLDETKDFRAETYDNKARAAGEVWQYEATAGTRAVTKRKVQGCAKQPGSPPKKQGQ